MTNGPLSKMKIQYDKNTGNLLLGGGEIPDGIAVHLTKLGTFFKSGVDPLGQAVPERLTHTFALHPKAWHKTFYSLTLKDPEKITRYGPVAIEILPGTLVAEMSAANKFYRGGGSAEDYQNSIKPLSHADIESYRMPELLIPRSRVTSLEGIHSYLAGLHSSAKEPVRLECESHFSRLLNETIYGKCVWHVDPSVVSAVIECAKTKTMNVLSRNMDSQRGIYPWRLSFFDKETGEAIGHRYGRTASEAVNFNYYDQCTVVDVKRR